MKVKVKWLKSPRQKYGIPRAPGSFSVIDERLANKIAKEDAKFFEVIEKERPVRVKDSMAKKPHTRPVKK